MTPSVNYCTSRVPALATIYLLHPSRLARSSSTIFAPDRPLVMSARHQLIDALYCTASSVQESFSDPGSMKMRGASRNLNTR